jgi:tetratricopeptide (TPR) repeat protein
MPKNNSQIKELPRESRARGERRWPALNGIPGSLGILILAGLVIALSVLLYHLTVADIFAFEAKHEFRQGNYESALDHLETSFQHWTRDPAYYQLYARALRGMARRETHRPTRVALLREAKAAYSRAIELNPQEGDYWFGAAKIYWWMDALDLKPDAKHSLERLLLKAWEKDPNSSRYLFVLAHYYLSNGDQAQASHYIKRLAGVSPQKLLKLRHHPKWTLQQEADFRDGLTANRSNALIGVEILSTLANAAAENKRWGEAVRYMQDMIKMLGEEASSWEYERLCNFALEQGNAKLALESFRKSVELSPTPEKRLLTLFWHFVRAGALDIYKAEVRTMAKQYPDVKNHQAFLLGQAQFYSDQFARAAANFTTYLENHESRESHRYLAQIALKRKDWRLAESHARQALEIDDRDSQAHYLLSQALNGRGRYKEALMAVNTAMKLRGKPVGYLNETRAWIYWNLKRYEQAIADWQKAYDLDRQQTGNLYWIAKSYIKLDDLAKAEEFLARAIKLRPTDSRVKKELAALKKRNKRP